MALPRAHLVNPQLGTYFGIVVSLMVGLVMLMLVFERLGLADTTLRAAMLLGPIAIYLAIALATPTRSVADFYVAGRRVPAFFNGLVLMIATLGGTGMVAVAGALFIAGFDALSLLIGMLGGLVVMTVLIAPYLRKFGAYTLPGYFAQRFHSPLTGVLAATLLTPPLLLLLVAEISVAVELGAWLIGAGERLVVVLVVLTLLIATMSGGARSQSWSSSAKALLALLALMVPATILTTMLTYLPLPQMSHGPVLRALGRMEFEAGIPVSIVGRLAFDMPGSGLQSIARRFAQPFGTVGSVSFVLASLAVMIGVAASPALLMRAGTTTGVHETRKSLAWSVVLVGVAMMTLSAVAVLMRDIVMKDLLKAPVTELPGWFRALVDMGLAGVDPDTARIPLRSLTISRDAVVMALPMAAGLPSPIVYLSLAGGIAAALAAAAQTLMTLATILADDVFHASRTLALADEPRLSTARVALLPATLVAGWMAVVFPVDPILAMLWALGLIGAAAFPVLMLSIWWKRINAIGAMAGMAVGFALACITILVGEAAWLGVPSALAGVAGAPVGLAVAMIVSLATPAPARPILELVRDLRVPGGEAILDREMRRHRQRQRQQASES